VRVTVTTDAVTTLGKKLHGVTGATLAQRAMPTLARLLTLAQKEMQQAVSGPVLKVRSNALRGGIMIDPPHVEGDALVGGIGVTGSATRYATFLIKGGTITPQKGKYLAIPVGPALTGAGVSRYASARDVPGLVFIPRTRSGNAILAKVTGTGKNRQLTPYFVLKTSVTIGPHDYVSAVRKNLEQRVAEEVPKAVVEAFNAAS
jgi:hypothetical protein